MLYCLDPRLDNRDTKAKRYHFKASVNFIVWKRKRHRKNYAVMYYIKLKLRYREWVCLLGLSSWKDAEMRCLLKCLHLTIKFWSKSWIFQSSIYKYKGKEEHLTFVEHLLWTETDTRVEYRREENSWISSHVSVGPGLRCRRERRENSTMCTASQNGHVPSTSLLITGMETNDYDCVHSSLKVGEHGK